MSCVFNPPSPNAMLESKHFQNSFTTHGTCQPCDLTSQMQLTGHFIPDIQVCRCGKKKKKKEYHILLCYNRKFAI